MPLDQGGTTVDKYGSKGLAPQQTIVYLMLKFGYSADIDGLWRKKSQI